MSDDDIEPERFVTGVDGPVRASAGGSPHRMVNPEGLARPSGFSHVVVPAPGRTVYLAGQTAVGSDGWLPEGLVAQFDRACSSLVSALAGANARPEHLVSLHIFTTDLGAYLDASKEIGRAYRRHLGGHYPTAALVEVKGLVAGAKVELVGVAVVPEDRSEA